MSEPVRPSLDPALFGEHSARDARFAVKEVWLDLANLPDGHPEKQNEFLHRQMNEEMNVMENAARNLYDYPEAEWDVRFWLARQVADEARHTLAYRKSFERRGGVVGAYPVLGFQFRALGMVNGLVERLAVQNRTFEADGLDAVTHAIVEAREMGDEDLALQYEAQQADEVLHVRFANEYIRAQVKKQPRLILSLSRALAQAARAFEQTWAGGGTKQIKYRIAQEARAEAGFQAGEIELAVQLNERRVVTVKAGGD